MSILVTMRTLRKGSRTVVAIDIQQLVHVWLQQAFYDLARNF